MSRLELGAKVANAMGVEFSIAPNEEEYKARLKDLKAGTERATEWSTMAVRTAELQDKMQYTVPLDLTMDSSRFEMDFDMQFRNISEQIR